MIMDQNKIKKGQAIADKLRNLLLNINLRITYADGSARLASEDFKFHSKFDSAYHQRKAMECKINKECYKSYVQNLSRIKSEILKRLDSVLAQYTEKHRKIWIMYFIEKKSLDEIAVEVAYTRENINKIIQRFKTELADYGEINYGISC